MGVVTHTYRFSGVGEDFGPRKGSGLVILHTTESVATKNLVTNAISVAKWQDRDDTLGSYNRLIATDGVLSTVPDDHISGGVNPGSTFFKPESWLYDMLPTTVVNDPNSYALQLAAVGMREYFDANGWPAGIIDGFARSIIEEEERIGKLVVVANHAHFQPGNRTDAGDIAMRLVMKRYEELTEEDPEVIAQLREELRQRGERIRQLLERKADLEAKRDSLRALVNELEADVAALTPDAEAAVRLRRKIRRVKELVAQMAADLEEV